MIHIHSESRAVDKLGDSYHICREPWLFSFKNLFFKLSNHFFFSQGAYQGTAEDRTRIEVNNQRGHAEQLDSCESLREKY